MGRKDQQPEQPQVQLPPVVIVAGGVTQGQQQENLAICQQAPGWPDTIFTLADAIAKRTEMIMLDFTRDALAMRFQIDGMWHDLPRRDRASGDAMLAVMKKLANLNPDERRARQNGKFGVEFLQRRLTCTLTSQGVQTGERVAIELELPEKEKEKKRPQKLADLGMREKLVETVKAALSAEKGIVLISAPPKHGLSTTWYAALNSVDRFMRDFAALEDKSNPEDEIINVSQNFYDSAAGETPMAIYRTVTLKEPDVLVIPLPTNGETINACCEYAENKLVIMKIPAKNAVEALLRVLALKPSAKDFARAVTTVLSQRLARRLCDNCKQPYPPAPQLLQKLGIPAGRVQALYREWQPPPQPPVDEQGNPIPPQICPKCAGIGYFERTAIFELLNVNDQMRQTLVKQPDLAVLQKVAKAAGHRGLQEEAILAACLGTTSLTEIQRVLK